MYTRYTRIDRVLAWNSVDALTTQTALLAFEYALSYTMGTDFHGAFGSAMSLIYIFAALFNFGFDSNIAAFHTRITASRSSWLMFVVSAWIPHVIWVCGATWYLYTYHLTSILASAMQGAYAPWCYVLCIESVRKTAKHIARYAGYVRYAAFVEISATIAYIACVSLSLAIGLISSLWAILYIHAASAAIQGLLLLACIATHIMYLPHRSRDTFAPLTFHMHRIFVGMNEVAGTLYTGNFLIPFIAYSRGYEFASVFRLTWYTAQWFVISIKQIFATTGGIVLAQQKEKDLRQRKATFTTLTYYMHQVLYAGIAFVIIHSGWFFLPMEAITMTPVQAVSVGCILFSLTIVDSLCAFYLRWYIVEEYAHRIAIFNIISILGMDAIIRFFELGDIITIAAMLAMRTAAYIMILLWSYIVWNLRPPLAWGWPSMVTAAVASATWYVVRLYI